MKPVVISFYAGAQYYKDAAEKLKSDCNNLGLEHSIEEVVLPENSDWGQICRYKVNFYYRKLRELKKPILWVDVDNRINELPEVLSEGKVDFAAFLRGFRDLSNYHSVNFSRTWAPSFLYFNYTEASLEFTQAILNAEKSYEGKATDDYFLEEGWKKSSKNLCAMPIPRKFLSLNGDNNGACFEFGDSGNVREFKSKVDQHKNYSKGNFLGGSIANWIRNEPKNDVNEYLLEKAYNLDIDELNVLINLAKVSLLISPKKAIKFAITASSLYPRKYESKRILSEALIMLERFDEAKLVLEELLECEYEDWRNLALAKLVDLERTVLVKEQESNGVPTIPMWWAKTPFPGNVGDILNPYLIEKLTGTTPKFVERGKDFLGIGSIIKWAQDDCLVWGSGTSRSPEVLNPLAQYKSVRGPLTRREVLRNGGYCPEVYGDAAMLLPYVYQPKSKKVKGKVGYIPHYQHLPEHYEGDVELINVLAVSNEQIESFIDQVHSCEAIISTSLHGVIIAHAYGVPARWCILPSAKKQVHGDNTKYYDYFAGIGMEAQEPLDLDLFDKFQSKELLKHIPNPVRMNFSEIEVSKLLNAFPYKSMLRPQFKKML